MGNVCEKCNQAFDDMSLYSEDERIGDKKLDCPNCRTSYAHNFMARKNTKILIVVEIVVVTLLALLMIKTELTSSHNLWMIPCAVLLTMCLVDKVTKRGDNYDLHPVSEEP